MGSFSSCLIPHDVGLEIVKLVDSQGQVRLIDYPTTVAEVMLENPGYAISSVDELVRTRRVPVMKADDVLHGRKVYLLVPVDKVNSRLSDLQLAAISRNGKVGGRTRGSSKVSPFVETGSSGGENLEDLVKSLSEKCTGLAGQKNRVCKAWTPGLEPILEV